MQQHHSINPKSGYCCATKTYQSLLDDYQLPAETTPLSITQFVLSLLQSNPNFSPSSPVFIDSSTHTSLSCAEFLRRIDSLTFSLSLSHLSSADTALILSPTSFHVPVLYFSLLSLGVVTSSANPISTQSELAHSIQLIKPTLIFAVSSVASKLPSYNNVPIILIDSPQFHSMLACSRVPPPRPKIFQSDTGLILFSSGTTGKVKGVELTHANFISLLALFHNRSLNKLHLPPAVSLFFLPLFHVFGLFAILKAVSMVETLVFMERFDFVKFLETLERYRVTYLPVSPPLLVALVNSELTDKYDLSSLEILRCGGAPLSKAVALRFKARFPNVLLAQGYALTEGIGVASTAEPEESEQYGSVGHLQEHMQAKIVDPSSGDALPPGQQGELWLRGPTIMKGYVGDKEATAAALHPDGWLKTGDLCYFDDEGYLYIVGRLKELIKYKAYQVPPAELEHLLLSHPEIADVAVVPFPDEEAGEIPMAFVVRRPESNITASQVIDYVAKEVSPYKRIHRVAFIDAIPKNPAGKILRRELVKQATASLSKL